MVACHELRPRSKTIHRLLSIAALAAVLSAGPTTLPMIASAAPPGLPPGLADKLTDKAAQDGKVNVIVGLNLPGRPFQFESNLPDQAAVGQQRAAIATAQREIQNELAVFGAQTRQTYVTLPFISLSVNANALEHLLNSPRIKSIEEVRVYEPALLSTGDWIGSFNTWDANFGGQGVSVAIIDTGIDNNHPFFSGGGVNGTVNRVVDEACFSTNDAESLCPDGSDEQYGPGAADVVGVANCYVGSAVGSGNQICDHGSHVAGIAAGQDDGTRGYDGVAPKAGIVAIQAAHREDDCDDDTAGDQPCVKFFSDDTIAGLDWVRLYSDTHNNVAAVNMSLGGGFHYEPCNGEAEQAAVQNLRTAGIATVISAGNDGWTWATGSPGCVPEAVTVGGVFDGPSTAGDLADDVLFNLAYWVDLMAVGSWVDSSVPDDTWDEKSGTSMAAPQVTGAFAVIKSIAPDWTVDEIEQLLENTGVLVQDQRAPFPVDGDDDYPDPCDAPDCQPRTGLVKPRLMLDWAVADITMADVSIFKDCKPDGDKPVGEQALCYLTIENHGPDAAMDVQVVDTFISDGSADFELGTVPGFCERTTNPQNPSGKVTCDLGGMLSGEVVEIVIPVSTDEPLNIDNRATVDSLTPDPDSGNNEATDDLNFALAEADVVVTKTCKPTLDEEPFHVGDDTRGSERPYCEIIATNHGPSAAAGVVLKDVINATDEFSITAVDTSGVTCSGVGGPFTTRTITCNPVASLAKDASIRLKVTYNAEQAVAINDTAEVTTTGSQDSDPDNNQAQGSVQILGTADLSITKTDSPDPVTAGENLTYTLTIANGGPSPAENVTVTDELPAGVALVSVTPSTGSCGAGTTNCNLGTLADGASATITIVVQVLPGTRGQLDNSAEVGSDTYDPVNGNNKATASTIVMAAADLAVTKTLTSEEAVAGAEIAYRVMVTNLGPSTATNVVLTDTMPDYTSFVSAKDANDVSVCTADQTPPVVTLTCDLGTFLPGQAKSVFIIGTLDPATPEGSSIVNTATVAATETDPVPGNNTAETDDTSTTRADVWIDKVQNTATGNPSRTVVYSLTAYNRPGCEADDQQTCWPQSGGPSDAQNVVVTDTLPLTAKEFVVQYVSPNCTYDEGSHVVTCTAGTLAYGQSATFDIEAVVRGSKGTLTNTATVSTSTDDPNSANDTDVVKTTVQGGTGRPGNR